MLLRAFKIRYNVTSVLLAIDITGLRQSLRLHNDLVRYLPTSCLVLKLVKQTKRLLRASIFEKQFRCTNKTCGLPL